MWRCVGGDVCGEGVWCGDVWMEMCMVRVCGVEMHVVRVCGVEMCGWRWHGEGVWCGDACGECEGCGTVW